MRAALLLAVLAGCHHTTHVDLDPVTDQEATAFTEKLLAAGAPSCTPTAIEPLLDNDVLQSRMMELPSSASDLVRETAFKKVAEDHAFAQMVCAWFGQDPKASFKLLRVMDGAPIVRKLWKPKAVTVATYFKLIVTKHEGEHEVRLGDMYGFADGYTVADNLNAFMTAGDVSGEEKAETFVDQIRKAKSLKDQGKPQDALAVLDEMDATVKQVRAVQMMRIAIAADISQAKYGEELSALVARNPKDPSLALLTIDEALLRKDYGAALHSVDIIDHAIGGDPYQDAVRSSIYFAMAEPEKALAAAKRGVAGEPTIARGQLALLDALVATGDFVGARAQLDVLANMKQVISASALAPLPHYQAFAQSPQFADWAQQHP